jgi:hypothetical protein
MSDYILVTNFWNEFSNIRPSIKNISAQTIIPRDWLFIDDGSPEFAAKEARDEILSAGADYGLNVHYSYSSPMKLVGDKYSIGKAWNSMIPLIKEMKTDYIGIVDLDTQFEYDYFEQCMKHLNHNPSIGVVAGSMKGEYRHKHMPLGGGKLIRWEIFENIGLFWNLAPDTFFNIKSLAMGYKNDIIDNLFIEGEPTTPRIGRDLGYRLYYCGNSIFTALFKTLHTRDLGILIGFLASRGKKQCEDPDIRYYYSKRRILKSLFNREMWI